MKNVIMCLFLLATLFAYGQASFYTSNLPIVVINTNGANIPNEPKILAQMKIIFNGQGKRNNLSDTIYNYNGTVGIELRGNSSLSFNQKQYTFETRDNKGENLNVSLLGLPAENDWVLNAPYNDVSMIRNVLAYSLWNTMGYWAPRTRMVEVVLNDDYQGVYVLLETIKKDNKRVDIAELTPRDTTGFEITGGYIMRIDAAGNDDLTFTSKVDGIGTTMNKKVIWMYDYPYPYQIHPKQQEYIRSYIDTVELVIQSDGFADPLNGYAKYIDVESFIDYFIHSEVSLNSDGYKRSAYFYKEKLKQDGTGGKLVAGPVWDYNLAFGNCNFCNGNKVTAWCYEGCETNPTPAMWKRLTQDPNFMNAVKCRYLELRERYLSETFLYQLIDDYAELLDEAQSRHFEQWPELFENNSPWGGGFFGGTGLWFSAYTVSSYSEEIDTLKGWLAARLRFLDQNLGGTCNPVSANNYAERGFSVFPNPAVAHFTVESFVPVTRCSLFDLEGKMRWNKDLPLLSNFTIDQLDGLSNGLYVLLLECSDGSVRRTKLMKTGW